jgi:hypothetical protein
MAHIVPFIGNIRDFHTVSKVSCILLYRVFHVQILILGSRPYHSLHLLDSLSYPENVLSESSS